MNTNISRIFVKEITTKTIEIMKAQIKKSNNGYGETIYNVILTQTYNNGFETVERFVKLKSFSTEKRAESFIKKQGL